jgi:hypothetical protein
MRGCSRDRDVDEAGFLEQLDSVSAEVDEITKLMIRSELDQFACCIADRGRIIEDAHDP